MKEQNGGEERKKKEKHLYRRDIKRKKEKAEMRRVMKRRKDKV